MRTTALIRKLLELELLEAEAARQARFLKRQLQQKNVAILERDDRELDIRIQYRWNGRVYETIFMRPMLDAEVRGMIASRLGGTPS